MKKDKAFRKTGKIKDSYWEVAYYEDDFLGLHFYGHTIFLCPNDKTKPLRKFIKALKKGLRRLER